MCRERTSPTVFMENVSFHLCLQESCVLTVVHSNKNVFLFYFTLLKVSSLVKKMVASVWRIIACVWKRECNPAHATNALTMKVAVAERGMNRLQ